MKRWLRRFRGALLMGLVWAVIWMPLGLLIGQIVDPDGAMDEPWMLVGMYPGFLAGVLFSVVLGVAARRRTLNDLSTAKVARWGALAGALIGAVPFFLGDLSGSARALWWLPLSIVSAITLLSTASAAGSLLLAKKAAHRQLSTGEGSAAEITAAKFGEERPRP